MLPDIHLDEENFEEILAKGRKAIAGVFPQWTDFNAHDPGITLLELFAALKESQQYFADRIGEENQKRFLKLLGIQRRKKQAAHSFVRVEAKENYRLFSGQKLDAGTLCFETLWGKQLVKGDIRACLMVADGEVRTRIGSEQLSFGNLLHVTPFGSHPAKDNMFCLCFAQALPVQTWLDLYIEVYVEKGAQRNPLMDTYFQPLVYLEWQYYVGGKWKTMEDVQDETAGFLFGGCIRFCLPESMEKNQFMGERGYFIRAVLREGEYDLSPVFTGLSMNVCEVVQRETLVECVQVAAGSRQILIDSELAAAGINEIYALKGDIWYPVPEYEKEILLEEGEVCLTVYDERTVDADGVMVVNRDSSGRLKRSIGRGNGFPNQEIDVSDLQVMYESFEILVQDEETDGYRWWQKVEDFSASGPEDYHYIFDSLHGRLYFGDHFHGMAPKGTILLAGYARTMGSDGNIKGECVHRFRRAELESMVLKNVCDGAGGREEEALEACFLRARQSIKECGCAVTKKDYEKFAKQTPGLLIESCQVLSIDSIRPFIKLVNETAIYLVIKPYGGKLGSRAEQCYAHNIEQYLERYRMIGNPVYILFPEYVEMDVYVDAVVKTQYSQVEERLRQAVQEFFGRYRETVGCVVARSQLYGFLEKQDFVWEVRSLYIDARGNGAKPGAAGDVELSPYAVPVLREIKTFLVLL